MTRQVDSLRRASNAAVELMATRTRDIGEPNYRGGVDRKQALTEARAIRVIAAGLLSAAQEACEVFRDPPPPENHYHDAPGVPRLRPPGGVAVRAQRDPIA